MELVAYPMLNWEVKANVTHPDWSACPLGLWKSILNNADLDAWCNVELSYVLAELPSRLRRKGLRWTTSAKPFVRLRFNIGESAAHSDLRYNLQAKASTNLVDPGPERRPKLFREGPSMKKVPSHKETILKGFRRSNVKP